MVYDVTNGEIPMLVRYVDKLYMVPKFKDNGTGRHAANSGIAIDPRPFGYLGTEAGSRSRLLRAGVIKYTLGTRVKPFLTVDFT